LIYSKCHCHGDDPTQALGKIFQERIKTAFLFPAKKIIAKTWQASWPKEILWAGDWACFGIFQETKNYWVNLHLIDSVFEHRQFRGNSAEVIIVPSDIANFIFQTVYQSVLALQIQSQLLELEQKNWLLCARSFSAAKK
jgi:hypothetical protein